MMTFILNFFRDKDLRIKPISYQLVKEGTYDISNIENR